MDAGLFRCLANDDVFTVATEAKRDIAKLSETVITFMSVDVFVTSVEDVSNTKLPCSKKDEAVKNRDFKVDVELFHCLTIENRTGYCRLYCNHGRKRPKHRTTGLEKEQVVIEVTMSDLTCYHDVTMLNVIDRKGNNFREVTVNTSNVEVVNDKGGNVQSLLTGTFEF